MDDIIKISREIKENLRSSLNLNDLAFNTWILPLEIQEVDSSTINIIVPDSLGGTSGIKLIKNKYEPALKLCISEVTGNNYNITYTLENEKNSGVSSYINTSSENESDISKSNSFNSALDVKIKNANLNTKYTFDTFVAGDNNNFAHAASLAVAEAPGETFNPLFIWGGPGLGKTHLIHSIGIHILNNNPDMNVLYVTAESFTDDFINYIRNNNTSFKDKYRNVDVILLDDIQFIKGKIETQQEFFNTFNELYMANKAIVLTSDRPPREIKDLEERLRSRFSCGLVVDIQSPNYETRMAILRKKSETNNCKIDDSILDYIAKNVKSNIRDLEGAFNKVVALSKLNRDKEIDIITAQEALKDVVAPQNNFKITPDLILETVANYFSISKEDILSKKRNQEIAHPRQIVMYLICNLTDYNIVATGEFLGKNHSTIIHGCDVIEERIKKEESFASSIEAIKKLISPNL